MRQWCRSRQSYSRIFAPAVEARVRGSLPQSRDLVLGTARVALPTIEDHLTVLLTFKRMGRREYGVFGGHQLREGDQSIPDAFRLRSFAAAPRQQKNDSHERDRLKGVCGGDRSSRDVGLGL